LSLLTGRMVYYELPCGDRRVKSVRLEFGAWNEPHVWLREAVLYWTLAGPVQELFFPQWAATGAAVAFNQLIGFLGNIGTAADTVAGVFVRLFPREPLAAAFFH
jgi:hypothetical protein